MAAHYLLHLPMCFHYHYYHHRLRDCSVVVAVSVPIDSVVEVVVGPIGLVAVVVVPIDFV